jgi:Polyketide cyclase / dehydrase and lipid transport
MADIVVDRLIPSTPDHLYQLVSDVTTMGRWSPETTGCRWLGGATGPVVGAKFRGANRAGWRRWSTACTVVEATPGQRFGFDVDLGPLPVSRWLYEFAAEGDGCRVTESWTDRRTHWMALISPVVMGVPDREAHNRAGMEATLANLARAVDVPA